GPKNAYRGRRRHRCPAGRRRARRRAPIGSAGARASVPLRDRRHTADIGTARGGAPDAARADHRRRRPLPSRRADPPGEDQAGRRGKIKAVGGFTLPMPDGTTFRLSNHHGKMVFVNFWATWCEPCKEEIPAMERLWRRHKDEGFVMVGVSLDSNPKVVPPFLAQ